MPISARYVHTNLVARDWRQLAKFYQEVFGCVPTGPERDLASPALDASTNLTRVRVRGRHFRLPGHGANGPTLEIFQFEPAADGLPPQVNQPGWGHLAFQVDDVSAARATVVAGGGSDHGRLVEFAVAGVGMITMAYVRDPEGNLVELQSWR